ncbi:ketopantoate reductase family protein [Bacillus sp. MUM 13]|uniref:ketopantoate reductase family protein n=1 Tax=Bacillus sp. MUM 13 TaxID=1678001 RepID=UPI0008F56F8D|nr:ketopantoate reductase family protein [Bacillus sp. MUM 13]OIK07937.1 2-dehydropantoate 2-reductase [Bacillus sp. MUM 13]
MNIAILGAGALGAYYGARLQAAGQNVTFLVRQKRAQQLSEHGLYITSTHGNYVFNNLQFTENVEDIERPDLVIAAVKGYHLKAALPSLKALAEKGAKILPLLNGIEHISILQSELQKEAVLGGSAYIIATLDEKGHVVHTSSQHDLVFGPLHHSQNEICRELDSILTGANLNGKLTDSILDEMWNKYMFITAFSGVTTALNLPIGTIRKYPDTFELLTRVLEEMRSLAEANGISISIDKVGQALEQFRKLPDGATSSMHQDRRKWLTLELEHIQGGALRLAERTGIKLPVTEILYSIIKPFEN